ncbi:MAG: translation initiation factor IF-3 [Candidatus Caldatribacterium sp.]|nr:translation initiation factor IF-3 [Candidatus Caldatribacterium sp.]
MNHQIGAREVRLISPEGTQIGIVPLKKALQMAEEAGLDLVEVGPNANPPVCKIMDYGKFRYEKEKKAKLSRKKQKVSELKELNMRPKIDEHDYQVKLRSALRFLQEGNRVKVTVRFRGRELAFQERGQELLRRMIEDLKDVGRVEQDIKREGSSLTVTLAPKK